MFKNILVPIDPSRPFDAANDYAVELAKRFGSTVVANYIVDEELVAGAGEAVAALDDAMECVGRDAMDDFVAAHDDLDVKKLLSYGHTATVIFQSVLATGADLVVVGGYSGLGPKLWGSTVMDIVHHDERPTFVVRRPHDIPKEGERIVVPFDGSSRGQATLPKICRFAKEMGCIIDLVHVARRGEAEKALHILKMGEAIVQGEGVAVETHCLEGSRFRSIGRIIVQFARAEDAALIAMSRLGETGVRTGTSRTLAWLLTHSDLPVWVVRK